MRQGFLSGGSRATVPSALGPPLKALRLQEDASPSSGIIAPAAPPPPIAATAAAATLWADAPLYPAAAADDSTASPAPASVQAAAPPTPAAQEDAAPQAAASSAPAEAKVAAAAVGPAPGSDAWQQSLDHCLGLLKGPADETRFVGLLLVTKLLPQGSDAVVRQVLEALGTRFIDRLLLPLSTPRRGPEVGAAPGAESDSAQQAQLSCVLGLALLSACCRLPEVAAGEHLLAKCPVFLKVVKSQGLSRLLSQAQAAEEDRSSDMTALCDALECLAAVAGANVPARAALLESGALTACAQLLRKGPASGRAGRTVPSASSAPSAQVMHMRLLAVRLLALLLDGGREHRTALALERTAEVVLTVQALSHQLGCPSILEADVRRAAATAAAPPPPPPAAPALAGQPAAAPPAAVPSAGAREAARLQLETLQVLLMVLPLPEECEAQQRLQVDCMGGGGQDSGWLGSARRGLGWLLRSRTAAAQKMSALQLASALVDFGGPDWLLPLTSAAPPEATPAGSEAAVRRPRPGEFLQLVASAAAVELPLLLHDALRPALTVPDAYCISSAAPPPPPSPVQASEDSSVAAPGSADPVVPPAVSSEAAAGPPLQTAGERALAGLPVCYQLLEACIEALAADSGRQEEAEAGDSDASEGPEPILDDTASCQLLATLGQCVTCTLQFFEALEELPPHEAAAVDPALQLGAVRVVGRFLAEAPASHTADLLPRLPYLLSLHGDDGGEGAQLGSFNGVLPQDASSAAAVAVAAVAAGGAASGVAFLLPGLLQAALGRGADAGDFRRGLATAPGALAALAGHLRVLVAAAATLAAAGAGAGAGPAAEEDDEEEGLAPLLRSLEQRAADVALLLLKLFDALRTTEGTAAPAAPAATAAAPQEAARRLTQRDAAPSVLPAVSAIIAWGHGRMASAASSGQGARGAQSRAGTSHAAGGEDAFDALVGTSAAVLQGLVVAGVSPSALMHLVALAVVVLGATLQPAAASDLAGGSAAAGAAPADTAAAAGGSGAAAELSGVLLAAVDVTGACHLALSTLHVGAALSLGCSGIPGVGEAIGRCSSAASTRAEAAQVVARVEEAVAEFEGSEAEQCWERMAAVMAALLARCPPLLVAARDTRWLTALAPPQVAGTGASSADRLDALGPSLVGFVMAFAALAPGTRSV